ncbi:GGDEF domain-containing protein [Dyella sp. S184]|uniref:tetratricopeptide repeat-containing diguanylate cyclase n=1 Tax=Dyella sp. S184 TaxID=1641862 RepID=UPI0020B14D79|nr:GGDEF domain-containing protein [Dyella sp. S184]
MLAIVLLPLAEAAVAVELRPAPVPEDPAQLLKQADGLESSDPSAFSVLMRRLDGSKLKFSPQQELHRRYLDAREIAFRGDFKAAIPLMQVIANQSVDPVLSIRAGATEVDLLLTQSRYGEAFGLLSSLLEKLPQITEKSVRIQVLGAASQMYFEAGQYDLAVSYAELLIKESDSPKAACIGWFDKLGPLLQTGQLQAVGEQISDGKAACSRAGDVLIADMFKTVVAKFDMQRGMPTEAINLLQNSYVEVQRKRFPPLISDVDELLAQAYWKSDDTKSAMLYALRVIETNRGFGGVYLATTAGAYQVLYQAEKKQGDLGAALAYHEKYVASDKGYLTDVSAKALAYQTVKQQVLANKLQIETLNKQNQILQLQQALAKKATLASRLYIVLLLLVLAAIALWTYRIKRSQLRFMKLARRDGLTGIFNRQHFVNEAELLLQYCRKSSRDACLVLIDLDHFKAVNDTHGHAVGDRVLQRAVAACKGCLRSTDIFGRLGGEEFGILLPECTLAQVLVVAEQIRLTISTASAGEDAPGVPISASFGISSAAHSGYELRQLLIHADEALYQAKREGRNRVNVADSPECA